MEYQKFQNDYVVRLDRGEEILTALTAFCKQEGVTLASVSGIGATDNVTVGVYDIADQVYEKETLTGAMEITSLVGNITQKDGEPYLHLHITVSGHDLAAKGGHLNECHISATCELFVHCLSGSVGRRRDESIGINLFSFQ